MRVLYICCFILLNSLGYGQRLVTGIVVDPSNRPLSRAQVFLNGTSFGTTTDQEGKFSMRVGPGRYDLVSTQTGFKTHHELIDANKLPGSFTISLSPDSHTELLKTYHKTTMEEWGGTVLFVLTGDSRYSSAFSIKNLRSIHLYIARDNSQLLAYTDEPLIIQNRVLGYTIHYKLDSLYCDLIKHIVFQVGYSYFQPMEGGQAAQRKWQDNRADSYYGSLMHFMRSVYLNRIDEEGFEVRRLRKVHNLPPSESDSSKSTGKDTSDTLQPAPKKENADFVDQVVNPDNYKDVIGLPVNGDSIAYGIDPTTAALDFSDFLLVVYRYKNEQTNPESGDLPRSISSQLLLIGGRPVAVEANGSYFDPDDLLILGDWSPPRPIVAMLPFDYVLPPR